MTGALAELERVAIFAQAARGLIPEWAPRPMLPHEVRARVNFEAINRLQTAGYTRAADVLESLRVQLVESLAGQVEGITEPKALAAAVTAWAISPPRGVDTMVAQATLAVERELVDVAGESARQLAGEAIAQGVGGVLPSPAGVAASALADDAATPPAAVLARLQQVALGVSQRPGSVGDVLAAVIGTSIDQSVDLARQAVNIAHGEGRAASIGQVPREAKEVYASELLDQRTCSECRAIDGRQYDTVEEAYRDYPDAGPYRLCKGRSRCRGTLVVVWLDEADATVRDLPPPPPLPRPPLASQPTLPLR